MNAALQAARLDNLRLAQRCQQLEQENARLRGECPAGGAHVWIEESPEDFYLITGRRRSTRAERKHCDHCGATP